MGMGPAVDNTSRPALPSPLPGPGGAPRPTSLPDWLGPGLGTISSHSFPNFLQSGANPDPWDPRTYVSPRAPLPDQSLITSDPAWYAPPYPWSGGPPRNGEPPSLSILRDGLDRAPYEQSPPGPRTPNSGPGTGGGNLNQDLRPQSPQRMNGLPDPGPSELSDLLGRIPLYGYEPLAGGSSEIPTSSASRLTSQPFAPSRMSPGVWPTGNAHSFAAAAPPDFNPWPLRGNGILGGYMPASAGGGILGPVRADNGWPSPGNGILGGLTQAPAGRSASANSAGEGLPSLAQMLQELWSRRLQDDPYPDDRGR